MTKAVTVSFVWFAFECEVLRKELTFWIRICLLDGKAEFVIQIAVQSK